MGAFRDTASLTALLAANIVPIFGVLFFGWDAAVILLLYWSENVVVGFYNVLRMAIAPMPHPAAHLGKLFVIPFFLVHFGGFCAVHGLFLLLFLRGEDAGNSVMGGGGPAFGPFVFVDMLIRVCVEVLENGPPGIGIGVLALLGSHGVSFIQNDILNREAAQPMQALMGRPYGRIVIMHIAIIAGGIPVMMLGSPMPLVALLVVMKIGVDLKMHLRTHRKAQEKIASKETADRARTEEH